MHARRPCSSIITRCSINYFWPVVLLVLCPYSTLIWVGVLGSVGGSPHSTQSWQQSARTHDPQTRTRTLWIWTRNLHHVDSNLSQSTFSKVANANILSLIWTTWIRNNIRRRVRKFLKGATWIMMEFKLNQKVTIQLQILIYFVIHKMFKNLNIFFCFKRKWVRKSIWYQI